MGFTKKTWKNRIAEYINRRLLTNEDGSTNLVTVARDEGTISQEGDAFNAANMNDLEDRIASEFEEINQSLTKLFTFENIKILSDYFTGSVKLLDSRAYREGNHVRIEVRFNLEAPLKYTVPLFYINGKFAPKTKTSIIVGSIDMTKTAYVTQCVLVTGRLDSTIGYYVFNQTATETLEPGSYYVSIDYSLLA